MRGLRLGEPFYMIDVIAPGVVVSTWLPPFTTRKRKKYETWAMVHGKCAYIIRNITLAQATDAHAASVANLNEWYEKMIHDHTPFVAQLLDLGWLTVDGKGEPEFTTLGYTQIRNVIQSPLFGGQDYEPAII